MSNTFVLSEDLRTLENSPYSKEQVIEKFKDIFQMYVEDRHFTIYYMEETNRGFTTTRRSDFPIIINATTSDKEDIITQGRTLAGHAFKSERTLAYSAYNDNDIVFMDDQSEVIASYSLRGNRFLIYFDLLEESEEIFNSFFDLVKTVLMRDKNKFSWYNGNQELITQAIRKEFQTDKNRLIRDAKDRINTYESNRDYHLRELTTAIRNRELQVEQLLQLESSNYDDSTKIVEQLELLRTINKVVDVHLVNGNFIIYTDDIYFQHDKKDERYHAGKYKIEIKVQNSSITYTNLTDRRRSYWGDKCHHPHVSETGNPCLGNIATTLAELCASRDIYSLVVVAISFLEAVNTDDAAGKFYHNWDMVDESGKVIKKGKINAPRKENEVECECCGDESENTYYVAHEIDSDGDLRSYSDMCPSCARERNVYYSHEYEEYMLGELQDDEYNTETPDSQRDFV